MGQPVITGINDSLRLQVNSSLNCTSCSGVPAPVIHWYQEGSEIGQGNVTYSSDGDCVTGTIRFEYLDVYDRDEFLCMASNGIGNRKSVSTTVRLATNGKCYTK